MEIFSELHEEFMFHFLLFSWFFFSHVIKGKSTYNMIVGEDGKPQIPEVFQYLAMNGAVVYGLEVMYYKMDFDIYVILGLLILAITGDIRQVISVIPERLKK